NFLFGNKDLQDGQAIDPIMMEMLNKVEEFSNNVGVMLNYIPVLTGYDEPSDYSKMHEYSRQERAKIPLSLEMEIKEFLEHKGLSDYGKDEQKIEEFHQWLDSDPGIPIE